MRIWQKFSIEGIVKITDNNLNLIKNINISRDHQQLKVILFDTGIFGFSPKPFARIIIADSIQIAIPSIENPRENQELKHFIAGLEILKNGFLTEKELAENLIEICSTQRFENKSKMLEFNEQLQLISVKLKDYSIRLEIKREFSTLPKEIDIFNQNQLAVSIIIDDFSYDSN